MASTSSLISPPNLTILSLRPQSKQPFLQILQSNAPKNLTLSSRPRKLRTVNNDQLKRIVEEHGAVEKEEVMYDKYSGRSRRFAFVTMKTVEEANVAIEKLNGTEIGGREIKVNITEKPIALVDSSALQAEDSQFIDSNFGCTEEFLSEKGKVMSAKVS
ncbi:30S ribosomal protein 2 [Hibiscus syriacus]|uniref:30S ribosomal protein 2 n=1 Tax=Hibiscus syriacus TaxID=106335 RepID=A0A6A3AG77_HIBSY|nr:30S ribosomal protein 2 [Hibiscus syriacus]